MAACRPLVAYKQKLQDILHEGIALDILKRIGRARMRLEQLTYLVSAAKAGSISAAAQRLNVSRQAVSSALGSLESELGVPFFKKGNQGIEPTFRGRARLEKAEAVLKLIEELRAEGRMDGTGNFSVCTTPLLSLYLTNSVFLPFRELHPEINVLLRNVYLPELMGELENGASRIAVVRTSVDMTIRERAREIGCEVVPLFVDEERLFMGATHPLAQRDALTPADLERLHIALFARGQEHIFRRYAPYFGGVYYTATRTDFQALVLRNEAVVVFPCRLFRHDHLVAKGMLAEKKIPLPGMDLSAPVTAMCTPELSLAERLFWDYLIGNFAENL